MRARLVAFGLVASLVALVVILVARSMVAPEPIAPERVQLPAQTLGAGGDTITCGTIGIVDAGYSCPDLPQGPYLTQNDGGPGIVWWHVAGDSITAGFNGVPNTNSAYPVWTKALVGAAIQTPVNAGHPGYTLQQILDAEVPLTQWLHDGGINFYSIQGGTNDFVVDSADAGLIESRFVNIVSIAHDAGFYPVMAVTVAPYCYDSGFDEPDRPIINAWLVDGGSGADCLCRLDQIPCSYVESNGVHPHVPDGHMWIAEHCAPSVWHCLAEAGAQ